MPLPRTIAEPYAHDALVFLPVSDPVPRSPAADVPLLAAALEAHLAGSNTPLPAITGSMRTAQRNAQATQNASRLGAARARVGLDEADVQLRTAEYELARVREEMAVCRAYEPMYETICMASENDFLASADPEVLAMLPPETDAMGRKYAILLGRLEAELVHVQAQESQVAEMSAQRDALVRSRREIVKKAEAVDALLSDYSKTTTAMASKIRDVVRAAEKDKDQDKEDKEIKA
ncbi:hypothetical protein CcaverHIS002_0702520 [Cutaneotrichosporon cavernicola]|uniref:Uncharacterized protein n=1 Tax=Cutaneotrichosporon cavernicola TaxID=279322 RepID=A0AA48QYH3_9TREE|nr:uncharacterized protein CcaverHIS019_0702600 [Cutaneotrichosporon cavernicola]BEI86906.1 hypothetical protein CcaverHIS002_0702520 [Cutaneotrichosporon cavernicola]BEI94679.1 hypothetical protein CcaverHIS019_0702600 [Cutaneotrichosporon cavernicola]BEJ02454.1 hypothetical protein CcaverHIS631_0702490 [Cutaneotrichosporon cavernicola]BEJ10213.1 hypothetical protein CcaverHIS641_0702480 [Cutaneotrichosporon cavernicola]